MAILALCSTKIKNPTHPFIVSQVGKARTRAIEEAKKKGDDADAEVSNKLV
jgi:hypothetical protein